METELQVLLGVKLPQTCLCPCHAAVDCAHEMNALLLMHFCKFALDWQKSQQLSN